MTTVTDRRMVDEILADEAASPVTFQSLSPEAFLSLGSMEGLYPHLVEPVDAAEAAAVAPPRLWPGYLMAAIVAASAFAISFGLERAALPSISSLILAIVLGAIVRNILPIPRSIAPGCKRMVKTLIPVAIVLTGAHLNLMQMAQVGLPAMLVTVLCIAAAIATSYYVGRWFGLDDRTSMLIGAGTGICGNSAIVAVAPLIDAEDDDLVLAIGTVNLFGLLAMLAWPFLGTLLSMSQEAFGVWSGTTIHAVPQAVAAGQAYGEDAGALATLVKLMRVTLLAPMMVVLAVLYARRHAADAGGGKRMIVHYARLVPTFVWGFVGMSLLLTVGLLPGLSFELSDAIPLNDRTFHISLAETFTNLGKILLVVAMAAIGLEVDVRMLGRVGGRALLTGLTSTLVLGGVSLLLITFLI